MAAPHNPPFRAEHVGSFLRPPELLALRARHETGEVDDETLRDAEDSAIRDVVALQEEMGLSCITDGEYRRGSYSDNFTTSGIEGVTANFEGGGAWTYTDRDGHQTAARVPVVHDRLRWAGGENARDFAFLAGLTSRLPKTTLPGPAYLHYRAGRDNISRDAYPDLDDFWSDLIDCYADEMAALADAGCRYVQLDETALAKLGDPKIQAALAARGDDWRDLLEIYTDAINAVVDAAPGGVALGMHLCRGNNQGHWQAAGGYDPIAEKLFAKLNIEFYFLEYDSDRAGTFEPLRHLPDDKTVVLGLVSTKTGTLEDIDLIKKRINEAAQYVDLERICLSPQCGFASSAPGNPLSPAEQAAKIARVIEGAGEVWG